VFQLSALHYFKLTKVHDCSRGQTRSSPGRVINCCSN